jgi:hypothetical protein
MGRTRLGQNKPAGTFLHTDKLPCRAQASSRNISVHVDPQSPSSYATGSGNRWFHARGHDLEKDCFIHPSGGFKGSRNSSFIPLSWWFLVITVACSCIRGKKRQIQRPAPWLEVQCSVLPTIMKSLIFKICLFLNKNTLIFMPSN